MLSLLEAASRTNFPKRDVAILRLMMDTGLRASEVCDILAGEIDHQAGLSLQHVTKRARLRRLS